MSFPEPVGDSKNFYCRDQYWQIINDLYQKQVFKSFKGATLRHCNRDNCRGAHCQSEINTLPNNYSFKVSDKSNINLVEIYHGILESFETLVSKVKHPEYIEKLNSYQTLNFIQLLNLWFDITCFYRRLKKNIIKGEVECDLYSSVEDIPEFFIPNENVAWPLERITKMCPKHTELFRKINRGEKAIIWDICIGSVNCKTGCHNLEDTICHKDLLFGNCDCLSKEEIEEQKNTLETQIQQIKNMLNPNKDKDGFTNKIKGKKYKQLKSKLNDLETKYKKLWRRKHLTDDNIVPFNVQMQNYLEEQKQKEEAKKEQIKQQETKKEERIEKLTKTKVKKILKKPKF